MSSTSACIFVSLFLLTVSTADEKYCITCKALMEDAQILFGRNFTSVSEPSLSSTTTSLCGKYYQGFEEVICRILCQVNASDLLQALKDGVPIQTICEKGGVCNDNFRRL